MIARPVLAAAALALANSSVGAAPVEILLTIPPSVDAPFGDALRKTEGEILSLLGSGAAQGPCPSAAPCRRYLAPGWDPKTASTRRSRLDALKSLWGEALRITEGTPQTAFPPVGRTEADWGPAFNRFNEMALQGLTADGRSVLFDGAREGASSELFVVEAQGLGAPGTPLAPTGGVSPSPRRAPPPPRNEYPFQAVIEDEARAAGIDPAIIHAIVVAKSNYDPDREGGGAEGLMMISPGAARAVGLKGADLSDPSLNVRAGSRLMAKLLNRFDGDLSRALAAYQAGTAAVVESGGIPNRRDVKNFLADFEAAYRRLGGARPPAVISPVPALRDVKDKIVEKIDPDPANPLARFRPLIRKAADRRGLDPAFFEALISVENTDGDPRAVSSEGAMGLGQLMPETAAMLGVKDPFDPAQNLNGAAKHFAYLMTLPYVKNDYILAAAAYNAGEGRVLKYKGVPPFRETINYVKRICAAYERITGKAIDCAPYLPVPAPKKAPAARKKAATPVKAG